MSAAVLGRPRTGTAHTTAQTILLHLAPGAVVLAGYAGLVPIARQLGLPSVAALAVAGLLVVPVVQLGLLRAHRRRWPDDPAVRLRARTPFPRLLGWVGVEVLLAGVAFLGTASLGRALQDAMASWWPTGWTVRLGTEPGYSDGALVLTAVLLLAGTVLTAPVVEELYFRGYLLPRMPRALGRWGTPAHVALFAGYHLWTPWLAPTRLLAVLPLALIAVRTRDVRIGIVTHVLLNAVDLVVLVTYLGRRG